MTKKRLALAGLADLLSAAERALQRFAGTPYCRICHATFPQLNEFGPEVVEEFLAVHLEVKHGAVR